MNFSTSAEQIIYEALHHFPKGRSRRLFERGNPGESIYISHEFGIKPKDDRLKAVRKDAPVIGTLAMLNVPLAITITEQLSYSLASTNIIYHKNWIPPTENVVTTLREYPDFGRQIIQEIQRNDLAIQKRADCRRRPKEKMRFCLIIKALMHLFLYSANQVEPNVCSTCCLRYTPH